MAFLINRNPSGRIICLHALLGYLYNRFQNNAFTLTDMKYDATAPTSIHNTCTLLRRLPSIPFPVCPYLENPLSKAKCYLTQSIQEDKQKSKSVSDAFNALEGLGFVERIDKKGKITHEGEEFVSLNYRDKKCFNIIRKAVMNYGPFVGLLYEIYMAGNQIKRSDVKFGYPTTLEMVRYGDKSVRISSGSESDTITRTRSVLFIWAITGGFVLPNGFKKPSDFDMTHVETLDYIKSENWTCNTFDILVTNLFEKKIYVENPLSYLAMTKSTKALRERNQQLTRSVSLEYEPMIKNRRFAIVYTLAKCAEDGRMLNFKNLISELAKYPKLFVINNRELEKVMEIELDIAPLTGIPFHHRDGLLEPITRLNIKKLCYGAPYNVITTLDSIYKKAVV